MLRGTGENCWLANTFFGHTSGLAFVSPSCRVVFAVFFPPLNCVRGAKNKSPPRVNGGVFKEKTRNAAADGIRCG